MVCFHGGPGHGSRGRTGRRVTRQGVLRFCIEICVFCTALGRASAVEYIKGGVLIGWRIDEAFVVSVREKHVSAMNVEMARG